MTFFRVSTSINGISNRIVILSKPNQTNNPSILFFVNSLPPSIIHPSIYPSIHPSIHPSLSPNHVRNILTLPPHQKNTARQAPPIIPVKSSQVKSSVSPSTIQKGFRDAQSTS